MIKDLIENSYLFGGNAPYVEELYEQYLEDPNSVDEKWRQYFDRLQQAPASDGRVETIDVPHAPIVEAFAQDGYKRQIIGFKENIAIAKPEAKRTHRVS